MVYVELVTLPVVAFIAGMIIGRRNEAAAWIVGRRLPCGNCPESLAEQAPARPIEPGGES